MLLKRGTGSGERKSGNELSAVTSNMADDQEGVINLGLGARGDIGERNFDVSGHRDVTFKPTWERLKEGKQMLLVKSSRSNFSATVKQIISTT